MKHWKLALFAVLFCAMTRLVPHPPNFVPVASMGIFVGAFAGPVSGIVLILMSMVLSDAVLGFATVSPVVYGSLVLYVLLSRGLDLYSSKTKAVSSALLGSVSFFLITNFAVWLSHFKALGVSLLQCYVQAIPFFWNTLAADALYTVVFFGMYHYYVKPKEMVYA